MNTRLSALTFEWSSKLYVICEREKRIRMQNVSKEECQRKASNDRLNETAAFFMRDTSLETYSMTYHTVALYRYGQLFSRGTMIKTSNKNASQGHKQRRSEPPKLRIYVTMPTSTIG
jgi:hypothetical protein